MDLPITPFNADHITCDFFFINNVATLNRISGLCYFRIFFFWGGGDLGFPSREGGRKINAKGILPPSLVGNPKRELGLGLRLGIRLRLGLGLGLRLGARARARAIGIS